MAYEISFLAPKVKVADTFVFETSLWSSEDKMYMAPMHGLTDYYFRNAFAKIFPCTIDKAISPFLSLTHGKLEKSTRKFKDLLPINNNNDIELIPQILGNDINGIIEVANTLKTMGYNEINWNLGCPFKKITNKNRGAALLKDTEFIEKVISELFINTDMHISLKVRLGYDSTEDIFRLIPIVNSYPISSITIHPRLGVDEYSSEVDLDIFEEVSKTINKKIIYNGDIKTVDDFKILKNRFPQIKDWMIGRWLIYNPFLAAQIRGINYPDKMERLIAFNNELVGSGISVNKIKEFWGYFSKGLNWEAEKLDKINHLQTIEEITEYINTQK